MVQVMQVTPKAVQFQIDSYGVLQPKYQTQLIAEVKGKITHVASHFDPGEMVASEALWYKWIFLITKQDMRKPKPI